jgi:hypothetical protein
MDRFERFESVLLGRRARGVLGCGQQLGILRAHVARSSSKRKALNATMDDGEASAAVEIHIPGERGLSKASAPTRKAPR